MSNRPNSSTVRSQHPVYVPRDRDVCGEANGGAADRGDLGGDRLGTGAIEVGDGDGCTFRGEAEGDGAADAGASAGNDSYFVFQLVAHQ